MGMFDLSIFVLCFHCYFPSASIISHAELKAVWHWGQSQQMETSSAGHFEGYNVSLCHAERKSHMCALGLHNSVGDSGLVPETPDNAVVYSCGGF